jgi:probable non-F420 flavinoid oxidoreductase
VILGFHASHEQIHPRLLLEAVIKAEQVGFRAAMCSDHFAPWSTRQGHSGFAWSWLGAALQATNLRFGVVNAPGQRYHPAIIAQAAGTLEAMYPGRFWAALGSGENVNEHITGELWPRKRLRNTRLHESVDVMHRLLAGEEVSHDGLITVDRAKLWTLPDSPPPLLGAATSPETAAFLAPFVDGLATVLQEPDALRKVIDAYRGAGGSGPLVLQVHLSYAATDEEASAIAHDQWRSNVFAPPLSWDIDTPEGFDEASKHVQPADLTSNVLISSDAAWHAAQIAELAELGFDEIYLHHVGTEQDEFLDVFGDRVVGQFA